ncbi:hypothetical protein CCACVL1_07268 [Corchorus capsularis]|uniref:Uncharacterized protein n=1 Tax=Corchorus capsularis TaxID=210143 RepID=A0A1R3G992_COCAP|nr:hypothetical protein CCACVL1_27712 [Corchorus capsularis]OMO90872.1 hypothetical protein CCACVL1_07268 [Corchorus capsularis]
MVVKLQSLDRKREKKALILGLPSKRNKFSLQQTAGTRSRSVSSG